MIRRLLFAAALLLGGGPAAAETVAIVNARVLTQGPGGDIARGAVVVRDGRIVAVGAGIAVPSDARVIDAKGQILTPGLVATVTPIGLNDTIGSGYGGRGSNNPRLSAGFDVLSDVNPNSPQIPEARIEGVTRAVVTPNPQMRPPNTPPRLFGGQAAVIHLAEGGDLTVQPRAALYLDAGEMGASAAGGSRGALFVQLARALADARAHARNPASVDPARLEELSLSRADLEALVPVAEGREPLLVEANRASDIRNVLAFAREQKVRVILSGGSEAWMLAREIAAAKVPVVIDAEENQAFQWENLNATYENAAILSRAGVLVAFKPSVARIVFLIRTPRYLAGRAARFGITPHEALAAITLNPARIFGLSDRFGSIEPGKEADLVLWSGDPLETTTVARMVMIRGVEQPLTARNRLLRDRYIGTVLAPAN
ncbi:amidohydrolase family protein [Phenylobacterium sp.]|uniref:amidohydrolase family protein n=1 Tax=Phenylobacterium sp. TaxID=1871053 RepID=UPI00301DFDBD